MDDSIAYPAVQQFAKPLVGNRVKILAYVDLDDPTAGHLARLWMKNVERLLRRTSWPKAVRAIQKILLIHSFQRRVMLLIGPSEEVEGRESGLKPLCG